MSNWSKVITDPRKYVKSRRQIPVIPQNVLDEIVQHAERDYPKESCGAIVLRSLDGQIVYCPVLNTAPIKSDAFRMNKVDQAKILATGEVIAIVHSHPDGPAFPSELDMARQIEMRIPWVIYCFGKDTFNEFVWLGCGNHSLRDRSFRHGVTDCYGFGRDYFLYTLGLEWTPRAYDWYWWKETNADGKLKSFYLQNAEEEGFVDVGKSTDPQLHDVFLCCLRSQVPNHMMVYVGAGEIAHHPASFLGYDRSKISIVEPYQRWFECHTHTMRHRSLLG